MVEIKIVKLVSIAQQLRKIDDLPLEARVDKNTASKNVLESNRKRIPLLDRVIKGNTNLYASMEYIRWKYGGLAAFYPNLVADADNKIIRELSEIVGYSNNSFTSMVINPIGFGVTAGAILFGVGARLDRRLESEIQQPIERRQVLKRSSTFLGAAGMALGGGLGFMFSLPKNHHIYLAMKDAQYVDSKIRELYRV